MNRLGPTDPLSDRMTEALIRRTLCPHQLGDKGRGDAAAKPIEELLPPLTSRNDVDLQLYAFLAIILRDFVQSWYSKITPDVTFIEETIQIVAHCTTALEQRFRKLDLESLLLDELPDLLDKHINGKTSRKDPVLVGSRSANMSQAYRTAHAPATHPSLEVDPREVYHSLMPLPYLSPIPRSIDPTTISEQLDNEAAYRQLLVQGALAVLLPTEDLENPCLTALVGQIFSELVIGNVIANKAAQPWLLLEGICILARVLREKKETATEKMTPARMSPSDPLPAKRRRRWSVHAFFLWLIQVTIFLVGFLRLIFTTLAMPSTLPARSPLGDEKSHLGAAHQGTKKKPSTKSTNFCSAKTPVLAFSGWSCLGNMIEMPIRMPWLSGFLSFLQAGAIKGPGQVAGLNSAIDRYDCHLSLLSFDFNKASNTCRHLA
jgi:splicing suppressor protein 51